MIPMAIVTTTGNLSGLLQTGSATFNNASNALAAHLNHFTSSFEQASDQIFSDFYQDVGSTSTLLKARLYYPSNVYIDIAGSGFAGSSGSVKKIDYKASPLSWTLDGSGSWSYSRGLSSLTIKNLEMRNAAGTEKFVLTGSINAFSGAGSLKSSTLLYNGFGIEQTGNFKLDGQAGSYSALSYSDAQGKVSITGKLAQSTVVINKQLGDLFDNPELFKGKDTFNVSDNSRAWYAFAGNDTMNGGALADELHGGDGNDKLYGNAGDDRLFGGAGNDLLDGGQGDDYLEGGLGNDTYTDMYGNNSIFDIGGNNKITTGAGNDRITSGDGKDTINAGAGDDIISAGGGANKVTGGAGADTFVFTQLGRGHITTLLDFNAAEGDVLMFDSTVFTALAGIENLTDHLVVGAKAKALDADDFLIYDSKSKKLYYDADGAGQQAAVQIAVLKNVSDLSADDISVLVPDLWLI
jgi:serralysin